jgi:hypothetical protein
MKLIIVASPKERQELEDQLETLGYISTIHYNIIISLFRECHVFFRDPVMLTDTRLKAVFLPVLI